MEAQINLLEAAYYIQRYLSGEVSTDDLNRMNEAVQGLNEKVTQISALTLFLNAETEGGKNFSQALLAQLPVVVKGLKETTVSYKALYEAMANYQHSADEVLELIGQVEESADSKVEGQTAVINTTITVAYSLIALTTLLGAIIAFMAIRKVKSDVISPLEQLTDAMAASADGQPIKKQLLVERSDEIGSMAQSLQVFVRRFEDNKRLSTESSRIALALQVCNTQMVIVDQNRQVIYQNDAFRKLLESIHTSRSADTGLAQKLVNAFFDKHQCSFDTERTQMELRYNDHALVVNMTPVKQEGAVIGAAIEFIDRTDELAIEQEIDGLVNAAANGELGVRIDLQGKSGFFEALSKGLNELVSGSANFVNDIGRVFAALAEGDLTQPIEKNYRGEFDRIKQNANTTIEKLTGLISRIRDAASTVNTAANEIAQGNADLSRRTEEQASSLEETASSMEQMTAIVRQSAANADEANTMAVDARKKAQEGGAVVDDAVNAMSEILTASKRISDIIGVIDEIAFQTNLLALNAAVEAARAGEQGRGFAVVASEVRNLSQRSAAAAKEIKDLIRDSVGKVEIGSGLVNQSGATLREIVFAVERVAEVINSINAAAREQTLGIEQVNKTVIQMDEMTQRNAALVEEASSASESMSEQTSTMAQLISFFQTDGAGRQLKTWKPDASSSKRPASKRDSDVDADWEDF